MGARGPQRRDDPPALVCATRDRDPWATMIDRPDTRGRTLAEGAHAESARAQSDFVDFAVAETEQSIPERFEEQARKFPERIALRVAGREFTYDALNRAANRIARAILAIEAEGEQRV